jgi:glutamate-1-semialdehyde 2,1-aminomutase
MTRSESLFHSAQRLIPGGVNSPVRAFRGVGGTPFFVASASGARIEDVDGRSYIDFLGSWGPLILGHAAPAVVEALSEAARRGTSYGAPTAAEVEMAELITRAVPSMEMVRLVSSGTEAAMSAIRLARGATGRDLVVKFDGCYHGHADSLLVKAGSGGVTFGVRTAAACRRRWPRSPWRCPSTISPRPRASWTTAARRWRWWWWSRWRETWEWCARARLSGRARELCTRHGALLLFDEVITGFRVAYGGAQALYGVRPDLTCLGKIIGGGLPVGAYGGRRDLMEQVAPLGGVYQAGTLSGNPLAVAAAWATLRALEDPASYRRLETLGRGSRRGWRRRRGAPACPSPSTAWAPCSPGSSPASP